MGAGRYAESRVACEEAVLVAQAAAAPLHESRARAMLGSDLVALGDTEAGLSQLREARRLAEQGAPLDYVLVTHHNLALSLLLADQPDEAVREALAGRDLARRVGLVRRYAPHLAGVAADALFRTGRWAEAEAVADDVLEAAPGLRDSRYLVAVRARLHAGRGESARAAARISEAMIPGGDDADPDLEAYACLAAAEVELGAGRPAGALAAARGGLSALQGSDDTVSAMPLAAVAARALAELAEDARAGRQATEASTLADEAGALLGEVGMAAPEGARSRPATTTRPVGAGAVAWSARARAEAGRAAGDADPSAWAAAATTAAAAGLRPLEAEARWRLAEILLRTRVDRGDAEAALRAAAALAEDIGAGPLLEEIRALARRARLELPDEGGAARAAAAEGAAAAAAARPATTLSDRELEVLRLVAAGRSNGEIATELFITRKTASAHVTHILDKLGVGNRLEAAMTAARLGLLSSDDNRTQA
jgi:DNA-binding NarL/FixJ family response regulator